MIKRFPELHGMMEEVLAEYGIKANSAEELDIWLTNLEKYVPEEGSLRDGLRIATRIYLTTQP